MSTIDPNKKIQRIRTEEEIRKALSNLIHRKHTMCIPPQVEDDDIVLYDAFKELLEARKKLSLLEPLRYTLSLSEQAWQEALQDPYGAGKVLEPMIRPLNPVKTPIHDAIKAFAMTTCEEVEEDEEAFFAVGFDLVGAEVTEEPKKGECPEL